MPAIITRFRLGALHRRESHLPTSPHEDGGAYASPADKTLDLTMTVLGLIFVSLLVVTALVLLRRIHARRASFIADHGNADISSLPIYHDTQSPTRPPLHNPFLAHANARNTRSLTIHTTDANGRATHCALVFGSDGKPMLSNPNSPPHSPDNVPAIHITFPDEVDERGSKKRGRVVVVRVGDSGVGLEPLHHNEQLPPYEKDSKDGFYSVDMDQIGGLREKEHFSYH